MKLKNIRITYENEGGSVTASGQKAKFWYNHATDEGGTEKQPYGYVTKTDLMQLREEIDRALATKVRADKERIKNELQ